jgi:hypothetical protein
LSNNKSDALSSITVPGDTRDTWDRIFDPRQSPTFSSSNATSYKHFSQAHGTAVTVPRISNWVGWYGTSESAGAILFSKRLPNDLEQCTAAAQAILLAALQQKFVAFDSIGMASRPTTYVWF